jgi:peptidoglycan/LPS O-acetylase OafA/YrhL
MNREVSAYLDCARILAAVLVVFDHVQLNWGGIWHFFVPLGSEAVAVLFVISGFVISYASSERETNMKDYLLSRAARLYSILIPSLLLCLFLDFAGEHFMPHYYANSWPPLDPKIDQIFEGLYSLTFLGHSGFTFGFSNDVLALWPYYAVGLWFALLTIGFSFSGLIISNTIGWMRWWAGASATLYLVHFPLGRFINGLLPDIVHPKLRALAIVLSVIGVTLIVASFGERRKTEFRRWIAAGCDWVEARIKRLFFQRMKQNL